MTEASVSATFMAALRKRLPDAVVIKHRDASFIGLPDCSVTYLPIGSACWLEFKLWSPPVRWDGSCDVQKIAAKSPAQYDMMKQLNANGLALYVVWARKTGKVFTYCPHELNPVLQHDKKNLVEWFVRLFHHDDSKEPREAVDPDSLGRCPWRRGTGRRGVGNLRPNRLPPAT